MPSQASAPAQSRPTVGFGDLQLPSDVASNAAKNPEVASYLRQAAEARGIDPTIAFRVVNQESSFNPGAKNINAREESWGPLQLNARGGLGAVALKKGINIRDPSTWRQQIDFALDNAKQDGWRQWYGARDVGISRWQGIGGGSGAAPVLAQNGQPVPTPVPRPADRGKAAADDEEPDTPAVGAQPAQAQGQPPTMAAPRPQLDPQRLFGVLNDPFASPQNKQIAAALLQKQMTQESFSAPYKDADGNLLQKGADGKISVLRAAPQDKETATPDIKNFEFAKKNGFKGSFEEWRNASNVQRNQPRVVGSGGALVGPDGKVLFQNGGNASNFEPTLVNSLADRLIAGDATWKTGLARNHGLIQAVEEEAARRQTKPETILQNRANQVGRTAEQRTMGTATASNTLYGNTAAAAMDTAIQASRAVPRTGWLPVNRILQMGERAASSPELGAFVAATNTLVNEYAKATTPVGVPTEGQREHAREMLNTAQSPEVYEAVVRMMHREIANTHSGIEHTTEQLRSGKPGEPPQMKTPPASANQPNSQSKGVLETLFGGGQKKSGPPRPTSEAEYNALPSGTRFIDPKGQERVKP